MLANSLRGVLAQLLLKKADGSGRVAVNEILDRQCRRVGDHSRRRHSKTSGRDCLRQSAGHAIYGRRDLVACYKIRRGHPHEAFMKAIDKNRFKEFLPAEEQHLGDAAGAAPNDEKRAPGNFVKRSGSRPARR